MRFRIGGRESKSGICFGYVRVMCGVMCGAISAPCAGFAGPYGSKRLAQSQEVINVMLQRGVHFKCITAELKLGFSCFLAGSARGYALGYVRGYVHGYVRGYVRKK